MLNHDITAERPAPRSALLPAGRDIPVFATPSWLHRPYFLAAIALTLTLGVGWGGLLLWQIGMAGSFTAVSIHSVNAHGEAQIYGWVGLFIMGFATQVFPRMWRSPPSSVVSAVAALTMSIAGVVLRSAGLHLHGASALALPMAMTGGVLNMAGIAVFCGDHDSTDESAEFTSGVKGVLNEDARRGIGKATFRGQKGTAERGAPTGGKTFGFGTEVVSVAAKGPGT